MNPSFIRPAFDTLCKIAAERAEEIQQHKAVDLVDGSNDEKKSSSSIFDSYIKKDEDKIQKQTNIA